MPVSTINQSGLANPLSLSAPVLTGPLVSGDQTVSGNQTVSGTQTVSGVLQASTTNISGILTSSSEIRFDGSRSRMHFFRFSEGDMGGQYIHMKTNAFQTDVQMYSVRFEGHDYSGAKAILCSLGWYQYQPANGPINIGGTGSHTVGAYKAADGYTVIWIQTAGYFTSFTLSQMTTTQGLANLVISAARSTGSSTGAY